MRGPNPQQRFKQLGLGALTVPFGGKTEEEAVHPGVDIANDIGTPIPAMTDGVVVNTVTGKPQGSNDFGNSVDIKDAEGNVHQFHHLQNVGVQPGQQVKAGQEVATMGNSGATYSPSGQGDGTHLDYRIVSAYGKYINPMLYVRNMDKMRRNGGTMLR
jgi:murein DD-endopeptidase MepM/ murein hydrolase activator NlpD